MSKPMSKKSAMLLGAGLWTFGAVLILFTVGQLEGGQGPAIIVGAGNIWVGTWVSTVAKAMKEPTEQELDKPQADT